MSEEVYDSTVDYSYKMKTYGHRGGFTPYDTMEAFKQAVSYGLDGVEIEVWLTKLADAENEELIVMSSGNYGEVTLTNQDSKRNRETYVWDYTYSQLKKLKPDICLLSDVLDFFKSYDIHVILEINFNDELNEKGQLM